MTGHSLNVVHHRMPESGSAFAVHTKCKPSYGLYLPALCLFSDRGCIDQLEFLVTNAFCNKERLHITVPMLIYIYNQFGSFPEGFENDKKQKSLYIQYAQAFFDSDLFAVRAGFEPAVQFNPYGSLANY